MRNFFGFLSGLIFGLGLIISGMANPAKVLNFLDLAGNWDPSLAFVMGGAMAVTYLGYRLAWHQDAPLMAPRFDLPSSNRIDRPLVIGAALFGLGWGIGGFCPGPAWTALPLMSPGILVFLPMMLLGLWLGTQGKNLSFMTPKEALK